jgi:hypothetical protein
MDEQRTYWQGQTDSRLDNLATDIAEIKESVHRIAEKVDGLALWRAKLAGIAVAASFFWALALDWLKTHLR